MKKILIFLALTGILGAQTINCSNVVITNGVLSGNCVTSTSPPPTPAPNPTPTILPYADPNSVLVISQVNGFPETGTGAKNGSDYVADYYMQKRNIPAGNRLRISTFVDSYPQINGFYGADSVNRPNSECQSQIFTPVKSFLSAHPNIKYIVPIYGVPVTCYDPTSTDPNRAFSLDSELSMILQPTVPGPVVNPLYNADPTSSPAHIDKSTSNVLIVSRLDGPSAMQSAGLVDLAIKGEAGVHGTGYFDYGASQPLGITSFNAYTYCTQQNPAITCVLNDQSKTGGMIGSATNTAWAWGGYNAYDTGALWKAYSFVPGAVGTSMNSNSAQTIRRPTPGSVVYWFLLDGVTATWGAVSEPYTTGYADGDNLLNHLWRGYTFGEAAYIASPWANWKMVFIGDPLYLPKVN